MRTSLTWLACVSAALCGCTTGAMKTNAVLSQHVNAAVADIKITDPTITRQIAKA